MKDVLSVAVLFVVLWVVHRKLKDRLVPSLLLLGATVAVALAAQTYLSPDIALLALFLWFAFFGCQKHLGLMLVLLCVIVAGTLTAKLTQADIIFFSTLYAFSCIGIIGARLMWVMSQRWKIK